jgi:hypothetical protein
MDIMIQPHVVINLDDDIKIKNIYEEFHNELKLFFSSFMSLNDKNCNNLPKMSVELGAFPSLALGIVPLAIYPLST